MNNINIKQYLKSVNFKIYSWCLSITLAWRLALELLNQLQAHLYRQSNAVNTHALGYLARWAHWDGAWYLGIVENGYKFQLKSGYQSIVFFPAFPLAARYLSDVTRLNPILAGLLLNTVVTSFACFFMCKLTITVARIYTKKLYISQKYLGTLGVTCLLLYPASLFLAAYYVESLLILGIVASIYFALKNRLWWAAVFMILATASKSSGLVLLPVDALIVYEQWRVTKKRSYKQLIEKISILFIGLIGLGSFMLYQLIKLHNAFLFYKDQAAWRPLKGFFLNDIYQIYYSHLFQESYYGGKYYYALNLFIMFLPFLIMGLGIWIAAKYKTYWPLALGFLGLAVPISTGTLLSLNRIEIITIPMATFAVIACSKKKEYRKILLSILTVSGLLLILFTLGFLRLKFAG